MKRFKLVHYFKSNYLAYSTRHKFLLPGKSLPPTKRNKTKPKKKKYKNA